ncbi:MAG: hypothetical protein U0Y68_09405 [Blastocatellia bacterium]
MKNTMLAIVFGSLFALTVWAATAATDFSGTWTLDAAKSEGLNPQMPIDLTWVITHDTKTIKKEVKGAMASTENYKFEGEVNEDVNRGQFSGKAKRTAKAMGEMVELKSVMTGEFSGNAINITNTQHLELADGGKTLKVHQTVDFGQGTMESKLVFTKK